MMEADRHIRLANIAKAAVLSFQSKGSLALTVENSRMRMRRVKKQQKHQVNMHHAQYGELSGFTDATRLKLMQVTMTVKIRIIPTGCVMDLTSTKTMIGWDESAGPRKNLFSFSQFAVTF